MADGDRLVPADNIPHMAVLPEKGYYLRKGHAGRTSSGSFVLANVGNQVDILPRAEARIHSREHSVRDS